jgi:hypothetical protein
MVEPTDRLLSLHHTLDDGWAGPRAHVVAWLAQLNRGPLPDVMDAAGLLWERAELDELEIWGRKRNKEPSCRIDPQYLYRLEVGYSDRLNIVIAEAKELFDHATPWWSDLTVKRGAALKLWPELRPAEESDAPPPTPKMAPSRRHDNRNRVAKALVEEYPPPPDVQLLSGAVTVLPPGTSVRMAVDRLDKRKVGTSESTISRLIGRKK